MAHRQGQIRQYIKPITQPYSNQIRINCPVVSVRRQADFVEIQTQGQPAEKFNHVVIATHSDQALALLSDPTDSEQKILGAIPYQENQAVLHCDEALLPSKKAAWASWNYHIPAKDLGRVAVTYDMNILQSIGAPNELCVSLNLAKAINPEKIYREMTYHHPVYNPESLGARHSHGEINGSNRTSYAGAYWGYGFHEDGVVSALEVCKDFGKSL